MNGPAGKEKDRSHRTGTNGVGRPRRSDERVRLRTDIATNGGEKHSRRVLGRSEPGRRKRRAEHKPIVPGGSFIELLWNLSEVESSGQLLIRVNVTYSHIDASLEGCFLIKMHPLKGCILIKSIPRGMQPMHPLKGCIFRVGKSIP